MPIHPKVIEHLKEKGLTTGVNPITGQKFELDEWALQMNFGMDTHDHASWHNELPMLQDTAKSFEEPLVQRVDKCKRLIDGGKEWVVVQFTVAGKKYDGTPHNIHWAKRGSYKMPRWKRTYNGKRNAWEESDILEGSTTIYEYPFAGEKTKIDDLDWKKKPLTDFITEETYYYVQNGQEKLRVSKEDWFALDHKAIVAKYHVSPDRILDEITRASNILGMRP